MIFQHGNGVNMESSCRKKKKKENAEMRELLRGTVKPTGQTSDGTSGH
jgi:hypothetical protein